MRKPLLVIVCGIAAWISCDAVIAQNRFATSDSMSDYVHWIDLYDESSRRIDPSAENPAPYSPKVTCGRCHEFETIAHGWHFNAIDPEANHGRPGQPWIWSDDRTGTHLPLSYRGWAGTFDPDELGFSRWQIAAKFGGFLPGGGPGSEEAMAGPAGEQPSGDEGGDEAGSDEEEDDSLVDRSSITGPLPVDCLLCHFRPGSGYSPFEWTSQIEKENFQYASTAASGIGTVNGSMKRLGDDFDPSAEDAASKLPKVQYESSRFRADGKVFFDLVRTPADSACYYCHTEQPIDVATGARWLHDEDVHLRAGIACADCHRNSLGHHTVRGYEGEIHPTGAPIASLSCRGCHLPDSESVDPVMQGRLGAPRPAHRGLPPLHLEIMTCTACHSGAAPRPTIEKQLNSIAHRLGEHARRTGDEFPGIVGPVPLHAPSRAGEEGEPASHPGPYMPHRMMWPSYWGIVTDGKVTPLNPEKVYELIRRPLRVRRDFTKELSEVRLSLSDRRELLGEDRARVDPDEWTDEEAAKIEQAEKAARDRQVAEHVSAALAEIENTHSGSQAVFVSGGVGFVRDGEEDITTLAEEELGDAAEPYAWPLAHKVRPARQSLGASGCAECHSEDSLYFNAIVRPVGLLPGREVETVRTATLQGIDTNRLSRWNQLFAGRPIFKVLGLIAMALTALVAFAAFLNNMKLAGARK